MKAQSVIDERHGTGGPWEQRWGYSRVVRRGSLVMTAGCTATVDGEVVHVGDAGAQTTVALGIALAAFESVGATAADVVHTRLYVVDVVDCDAVGRAHATALGGSMPAATMVVVAGLAHPDMLVEVELTGMMAP